MQLNNIRAMFKVGQQWLVQVSVQSDTFKNTASELRSVRNITATQIEWATPSGDSSMSIPKASQVIETRDDFLKFRIFEDQDHTLTLTRI